MQDKINNNEALSENLITPKLNTEYIGRDLTILNTVDSTNLWLRGASLSGAKHGKVVISKEQTSGKGRRSRVFESPNGGLYMSVLLKTENNNKSIQLITIATAVAVIKGIYDTCGITPDIKWVNDIYIGSKKLGGILTELFADTENPQNELIIIGIGLNTASTKDFSNELKNKATALYEVLGTDIPLNDLAASVLNRLEEYYNLLLKGEEKRIINEYKAYMFLMGKKISVSESDIIGTVKDVSDDGSLVVELQDKSEKVLRAGEVSVLPET